MRFEALRQVRVRLLDKWMVRPAILLTALLLAAAGQYLVNAEPGVDVTFGLAERFNVAFRLTVRNAGSTLSGLLLLLCGGFLFAFAAPALSGLATEPFDAPLKAQKRIARWEKGVFVLSCALWLALVVALRKGVTSHWFVLVLALLLLGITLPARRFLGPAGSAPARPLEKRDAVLVGAILVLGAAALFPILGRFPMLLLGDEGIFLEHAHALAARWEGNALGILTYGYPALGNFYQAIFVGWFEGSVWSWRFSSALASLAALPLFFLLFRQTFSRRVAFLTVILCVGSPYFLAVSRMGYLSNHTIPIVALFLVTLQAALLRRDQGLLFVAGVASGLGFLSYPPAKVSAVIGCLAIVLLFAVRRVGVGRALGYGAIFAAGNALLIVPHAATVAFHDPVGGLYKVGESLFLNTWSLRTSFPEVAESSVWTTMIGDQKIFFEPRLAAILVVRGIVRTLLIFHDHTMIGQQFMVTGMVGFFAPALYILGLCTATVRAFQRSYTLPVLLFFSCFFCLSALNTGGDRHSHLLPIVPAAGLFVALPLLLLAEALPSRLRALGRSAAAVAAVAIAAWGCVTYYVLMPRSYPPTLDAVVAFELTDGPRPTPVWFVRQSTPADPLQDLDWTRYKLEHLVMMSPFEALSLDQLRQRLPGAVATIFIGPELEVPMRAALATGPGPSPRLEPIVVPGPKGSVRLGFRVSLSPSVAGKS